MIISNNIPNGPTEIVYQPWPAKQAPPLYTKAVLYYYLRNKSALSGLAGQCGHPSPHHINYPEHSTAFSGKFPSASPPPPAAGTAAAGRDIQIVDQPFNASSPRRQSCRTAGLAVKLLQNFTRPPGPPAICCRLIATK